jgi:hypothetical protein
VNRSRPWRRVVVSLLAAACGQAGANPTASPGPATPAPAAGSCHNAAGGFCNEFSGAAYRAERVRRSCEKQKQAFLPGACPTEGRVGACLVLRGKNTESRYLYYAAFPGYGVKPRDGVAAEAARQCTGLKGEWTPS